MINTIVSAIGFLSAMTFCVTYHLLAPWWSSTMGRNLMAFSAAVGAFCAYTVAIAVLGVDGPVAATLRYLRTAVVLLIAALLMQRTVMVIRAQRPHD